MRYKNHGLLILCLISTAPLAAEERSEINFDAMPEAVRNTVSHIIDKKISPRLSKWPMTAMSNMKSKAPRPSITRSSSIPT